FLSVIVALALCTFASVSLGQQKVIAVQPLGKSLPAADVALVKRALEAFTGMKVRVLKRLALPRAAYYPPRRRYRGEKLLDFLVQKAPKDASRVLGLTGVDISTTKGRYKDWGILGLATMDGQTCVISAFRARKKARSVLHARQRLAKVAVHEIGHTLGLPHCPTRGCLMEDARGKVATSDGEYDLCSSCREKLQRWGHRIPAKPQIPWPRPR
ncbi:MAG: matrixin family metalloprotease, partial [Deltaproteobacteria bacterium]|nr:matrixin family metalloprotease [Deltaproteobacteria bacterium]